MLSAVEVFWVLISKGLHGNSCLPFGLDITIQDLCLKLIPGLRFLVCGHMWQLGIPLILGCCLSSSLLQIEAQRGGVALLHSTPFAVARLIENFPKIFLQGLDTKLRPVLDFLESMGVSADAVGQVVLLYPPVLLCDIDQDLKKRARTLTKVNLRSFELKL